MESTLKLPTIYFSVSVALSGLFIISPNTVHAIDLNSLTKTSTEQLKTAAKEAGVPLETDAMISYAAKQLNFSESTVSASFGALLKVAQDNLSPENFAIINKAVPDAQNYLDKAPKVTKSSVTSLFSDTGEAGKKVESLDYLNSAFDKLGVSRQKIPELVNSFSAYLDKSGYGEAAASLKKGLSLL